MSTGTHTHAQSESAMDSAFSLPAELTIYSIAEVHALCARQVAEIAEDASGSGAVRVDASAVAEVDGAGVQLLLSLHNALAMHARELLLTGCGSALRDAFAALGTTQLEASA